MILHPIPTSGHSVGGKSIGWVRVEEFTVGHDLAAGEQLQWIVEGGKWKATYLLPDLSRKDGSGSGKESDGVGSSEEGLLISETVVPGFDFEDHDFLSPEKLRRMMGENLESLEWLTRKNTS